MNRMTAKRLLDAQVACAEIEGFTIGTSINAFERDRMLQLAIHKLLEIVGEALNRAQQAEPDVTDSISNLRQFVLLRNRITHGYDSVDYAVVWHVATEQVPALRRTLDSMLEDAPPVNQDQC